MINASASEMFDRAFVPFPVKGVRNIKFCSSARFGRVSSSRTEWSHEYGIIPTLRSTRPLVFFWNSSLCGQGTDDLLFFLFELMDTSIRLRVVHIPVSFPRDIVCGDFDSHLFSAYGLTGGARLAHRSLGSSSTDIPRLREDVIFKRSGIKAPGFIGRDEGFGETIGIWGLICYFTNRR
ncbi:hypothetical protein CEXT_671121 [Caerostris extrusa]|uniref:Uncharacterized protein n=1 Tax=Caerostris extrusa TaxID=172846 RepID=A0AAV4PJJ5_CAEEX|nr:hypothetical protein CEXT_671121 [Caerostris extrusa]